MFFSWDSNRCHIDRIFKTCINQIITGGKEEEIKGNKISRNKNIKKLLFADDKVILAASEYTLKMFVHKVERVTSKYGIKMKKVHVKINFFPQNDRNTHLLKYWPFLLNQSVSYGAFTVTQSIRDFLGLPVPFRCLTLRRLMSYVYGAPILDVSRSHTTTQHSR